MKRLLSKAEFLNVLHYALCDGLATLSLSGVVVNNNLIRDDYNAFRADGDCIEDVYMRILGNNKPLVFEDLEGDEDGSFTLEEAKKRLEEAEDIGRQLQAMIDEDYDGIDASDVLQVCIYGKVIYG